MENRALIAVVISLAILVLYQELVVRRLYPPSPSEQAENESPPAAVPPAAAPAPERAVDLASPPAGAKSAVEARHIVVETDFYKATFTSAGARLESFQLKQFRTAVDPESPPQEMVTPAAPSELPFGVELRGAQVVSDADAPYTTDSTGFDLRTGESRSLGFTWQTETLTFHKRFTFQGDRYPFSVTVEVPTLPPGCTEIGIAWPRRVEGLAPPGGEVVFDHTVLLDDRKLVESPFDKLADGKIVKPDKGDIGWVGYGGRHFVAALVPLEAHHQRVWQKLREHTVEATMLFPASAGPVDLKMEVYIGPKDFDVLETADHELSRAVALGWFGFIAVPLLHVLKFSHRFTGNYGIDIILLTVVIKALFIPLTQSSFKSMRAMQKLQPQMAKIRERFKDDSDQMNKEIMELYRRHKVNPIGGCLPMVLQIPVFIGLYSALMNTVALRHAPFFLWINDLSAPDRLGAVQLPFVQHPGIPVLTLFMGASMFAQQWMTPSAADPQQQRVMMIMPLMFTFMFVNFPAGLSLYWLVNNILTIAQQYYMNRSSS